MLEKVNFNIEAQGIRDIEIEYVTNNRYTVNTAYVDHFNIYAQTLNRIQYKEYEIPLWEIIIWSAMAGYVFNDITGR